MFLISKIFIILILFIKMAYAQEVDTRTRIIDTKELLGKIELNDNYFTLTEDLNKFKIALSLKILEKISKGTSHQAACIVSSLGYKSLSREQLEVFEEMLQRLEIHESGYIPCNENSKTYLNENELSAITRALWSDKLLVNDYPSAYCHARAQYTSRKLDKLGFKSKKLILRGNIVSIGRFKGKYKATGYLDHTVNLIETKKGELITQYVIDPMFSDGPIELQKYLKTYFTPYPYRKDTITIKHQSFTSELYPPLKGNECKYNNKLSQDVDETLKEAALGKHKNPYSGSIMGESREIAFKNYQDNLKQVAIEQEKQLKAFKESNKKYPDQY